MQFSIHEASANGTIIYQETQNVITTHLGLFTCTIGNGVANTGLFASIDWSTGSKFLQVEMDPLGGTSFIDMGTTQLMSVPYALHAGSTENAWNTNGNSGTHPSTHSLGTNDDNDLIIKTDGFETARFFSNPNTGGGINPPTDRLRLMRYGLINQKWPMVASFQLGSYEPNLEGRTQLDIALLYGSGVNPDNKVMSLLANGNVGIGNTTPTERLDVNGVGKFGPHLKIGTDVAEGYFQNSQDGAYRALQTGGNQGYWFQDYNGANTSMYVGLNGAFKGRVGIGTVTPETSLHVNNPGAATAVVIGSGNTINGATNLTIGTTAAFGGQSEIQSVSWSGISWGDLLLNKNGGNVGIGTASPAATLHVAGTVKIVNGSQGAGKVLTSDSDGNATWMEPTVVSNYVDLSSTQTVGGVKTWSNNALFSEKVGIHTSSPTGELEVKSHHLGAPALDQQSIGYNNAAILHWQSFTAGTTGLFTSLELYLSEYTGQGPGYTPISINVYHGEGTAGTLLTTENTQYYGSSFLSNQTFTFTNPAPLVAGNKYTFEIIVPPTWNAFVGMSSLNPYAGGSSDVANSDFRFSTYIAPITEVSALNIVNGNVGIGTNAPTTELDIVGTTKTTSLQIPTGASQGAVLTSDSYGNASWTQMNIGCVVRAQNFTGNASDWGYNAGSAFVPTSFTTSGQFGATNLTNSGNLNTNAGIASSTGVFTAPVSGYYLVTLKAMNVASNARILLVASLNGAPPAEIWDTQTGNPCANCSDVSHTETIFLVQGNTHRIMRHASSTAINDMIISYKKL